MKKAAVWFLLMMMVFSVFGTAAGAEADSELRVGTTNPLQGNFFTRLWGCQSSDLDAQMLLHAYSPVRWDTAAGAYVQDDSVVNAFVETQDSQGNLVVSIGLYGDLRYSDGTSIKASDYAFSALLCLSPQMAELGGMVEKDSAILGAKEYAAGEKAYLAGVRLINDKRLDIILSKDSQPAYYQLQPVDIVPYPIHVIAPGCAVRDDGQGVYLTGGFTAELLRKTVMDPESGYRSHPAPVSGPYSLTSFDGSTATFQRNTQYKGNYAGKKPTIERIRFSCVSNENMMDMLASGEIVLLNKAVWGEAVKAGSEMADAGKLGMTAYPRAGLSFLSVNGNHPALREEAVRKALMHCLDRETIAKKYLGEKGQAARGFYGSGQWMALQSGEPNLDSIPEYAYDISLAVQLLEEAGWKPEGTEGEAVRQKEIDGQQVSLRLTLACPAGSAIGGILQETFSPALKEAGVSLTVQETAPGQLLSMFYGKDEQAAELIFLATNFDIAYDPAAHFNGDCWEHTGIGSRELREAADSLRRTKPGDAKAFCQGWLAFQQKMMETLPVLPVYTGDYYDFYTNALTGYDIAAVHSWSQAIIAARFQPENTVTSNTVQ